MVDISSSLPLMPAVIVSFLSSQVASLMEAYKGHELYLPGMIPVVLAYMSARSYLDLELPLPPFELFPTFGFPNNIWIYIETAGVVVISYVSLLVVNWSYIWLVVFPVIAIGFIVALCSELNRQSRSSQQHCNDGEEDHKERKKGDGLDALALVPYWALCVMSHFHANQFAVSQFLLFFGFTLGALTLMMARLALSTVAPGVAPASELLRKASLLVLLVAAHAMAAELLGESVVLFCLPEIAPVLLWFSVHLDREDGGAIITADEIKLNYWNNVLIPLGAAAAPVLAVLTHYTDESLLSWCTKALVSFGVSGLLLYYIVFILWQWPRQDGIATTTLCVNEAIKLLKLWANVLLTAAATLLVFTSLLLALLLFD